MIDPARHSTTRQSATTKRSGGAGRVLTGNAWTAPARRRPRRAGWLVVAALILLAVTVGAYA